MGSVIRSKGWTGGNTSPENFADWRKECPSFEAMAYSVTQRTQETGVRLAFGAQKRDLLALIFGEELRMILLGVMIGLAGSFALIRVLATQLYDLTATDPLTFASVTLLLVVVAAIACFLPA